jgi:peptidoglycan/xylan/chitin deacetylase (PgdA/CDA1 family)
MSRGGGSGDVTRRTLLGWGMGAIGGSALAACSALPVAPVSKPTTSPAPSAGPTLRPEPTAAAPPVAIDVEPPPPPLQPAPALARVPAPYGTIDSLPGEGSLLAWTVDDGLNGEVIRAYAAFAAATGVRLTLFVTGMYSGWDESAGALAPLIASGQVQLANHTWSHADLTTLDDAGVAGELQRAHDFIGDVFGVDARPFWRPPFGFHDERVDSIAADLGYTVPTLWYGSLSDSGEIPGPLIVDFARQWFLPQHIVIGHLNCLPVTTVFEELRTLIIERGLTTVTLNDVFSSEYHP